VTILTVFLGEGCERGIFPPLCNVFEKCQKGCGAGGWGKRGSIAKTTVEQNVDRKSENIYTSTQGKKLTHVNVFAYISKNHVKFKYQSSCFLPGNFISSKQKIRSFKYHKRELKLKANSKNCV